MVEDVNPDIKEFPPLPDKIIGRELRQDELIRLQVADHRVEHSPVVEWKSIGGGRYKTNHRAKE